MKQKNIFFSLLILLLSLNFYLFSPKSRAQNKINESILSIKKTSDTNKNDNYKDGEIIVKYKKSVTKQIQSFIKNNDDADIINSAIEKKKNEITKSIVKSTKIKDVNIVDQINELGLSLIKSDTASTEELLKKVTTDPNVEYVEPNYKKTPSYIPNDPYFSLQLQHETILNNGIGTMEAWDIEKSDALKTIVAVIDTGIDYNFSDLVGNMWDGSLNCKSELGLAINCPYHGWDYADNDNDPNDTAQTDPTVQGHGTFVGSIIGATNDNSIGIAGISRFNTLKLMPIRFDYYLFSEIKSINFAKNNGAKIINASFGGSDFSQLEKNAIDSFPGIVVTSAGNDSANNDIKTDYPCNYNSTNVICVGANNFSNGLASFSNYGENVDISAPGEDIIGIEKSDYYYGSGTSFSTPLVSGTLGLMYAHNPGLSIDSARNTLLGSSDHITSLSQKINCARKLNIKETLQNTINKTIPAESCIHAIYRFQNKINGTYLFTGENEKNSVVANYSNTFNLEGTAFYIPPSGTPIYRFLNLTNGTYLFTGEEEKVSVQDHYSQTFKLEGLAFYTQANGTPMYRFQNKNNGTYLFTSEEEKNSVLANYSQTFKLEGLAFYGN
jgi:subtilisin family serine protease